MSISKHADSSAFDAKDCGTTKKVQLEIPPLILGIEEIPIRPVKAHPLHLQEKLALLAHTVSSSAWPLSDATGPTVFICLS